MSALHQALAERARSAAAYFDMRARRPDVPARIVWSYLRDDHGLTVDQLWCEQAVGHQWSSWVDTRTEREIRCYCLLCGADGDA